MQFQCLVVNPQSDSTIRSDSSILYGEFSSTDTLCLKVARQLNTRSFWSVGFWWLCLFPEVGLAMQEWLEYFSLMVVLVHGNCASCMVNTMQLFAIIIGFIQFISIRSCVSVVSPI